MSSHHHHQNTPVVDNTVNLLLLGISESGKSTLFKQVKILHQNGYTKEELLSFKTTIQNNLVLGMAALIDAAQQLNFISPQQTQGLTTTEDDDSALNEHVATILKRSSSADTLAFDSSKLESIQYVWKHEKIQQAYHQRHSTYQIIDNLNYFLDHLDRIGSDQYVPTVDDILHCRLRTTGVHETKFEFGGLGMRLVDVGGQRNQRKKWIHVFDSVTALIFVVSLVEYNQVLEEDPTTIRMNESMLLFEELVNCSVFYDKPVMLFLNKVDSFNELIKKVDISETCFKDYNGKKNSSQDAIKFIENKFKSLRENKDADVFTEVTCAIDTNNIRKVLENLKTIILKESLSSK